MLRRRLRRARAAGAGVTHRSKRRAEARCGASGQGRRLRLLRHGRRVCARKVPAQVVGALRPHALRLRLDRERGRPRREDRRVALRLRRGRDVHDRRELILQ